MGRHGTTPETGHNTSAADPDKSAIAALAKMDDDDPAVQRKLEAIRGGGGLAAEHPIFPEQRRFNDVIFLGLFGLVSVGCTAFCYSIAWDVWQDAGATQYPDTPPSSGSFSGSDRVETDAGQSSPVAHESIWALVLAGGVGGIAATGAVAAFMKLAENESGATFIVKASLYLAPVVTMTIGAAISVLSPDAALFGLILMGVGGLELLCAFCCWQRYIPFMIKVTEYVGKVMALHPSMIAIAFVGGFMSFAWSVLCFPALLGVLVHQHRLQAENKEPDASAAVGFVMLVTLYWGGMVIYNYCHTTYAGVFGRWYFGKDEAAAVSSSAKDATKSLGSICEGSLIIAVLQALDMVLRQAQESDNAVVAIMACLVRCLLNCVRDIIEYLNEWAYIQCALRGVSFCDGVKIALAQCTCANVPLIMSDLLLTSVLTLGAVAAAVVGAATGAVVAGGLASGERAVGVAMMGALVGGFVGLVSGSTAMTVFGTGAKTIIACWAEDPDVLQAKDKDFEIEMRQKAYPTEEVELK